MVTRVATIEAELRSHAKRVDDHISKENEVHGNISDEIKEVREQHTKATRYVIGLLLTIIAYLIVSGRPWS